MQMKENQNEQINKQTIEMQSEIESLKNELIEKEKKITELESLKNETEMKEKSKEEEVQENGNELTTEENTNGNQPEMKDNVIETEKYEQLQTQYNLFKNEVIKKVSSLIEIINPNEQSNQTIEMNNETTDIVETVSIIFMNLTQLIQEKIKQKQQMMIVTPEDVDRIKRECNDLKKLIRKRVDSIEMVLYHTVNVNRKFETLEEIDESFDIIENEITSLKQTITQLKQKDSDSLWHSISSSTGFFSSKSSTKGSFKSSSKSSKKPSGDSKKKGKK